MKITYIDTGGMTDKEMSFSLSVSNEKDILNSRLTSIWSSGRDRSTQS